MARQKLTPGTVSKILWHFTGGPQWDNVKNRQLKKLKSNDTAYDNMKSILRSKEIRLGSYQEVVKIKYDKKVGFNFITMKSEIEKNVTLTLKSSPVCCLADIPLQHLRYHAQRYGHFAIGFYRDKAIKSEFNPVFYSLETTNVLKNIKDGFSTLEIIDTDTIRDIRSDIEEEIEGYERDGEELDISDLLSYIEMSADDIDGDIRDAAQTLENFLAFVKTFKESEFDTIYCEREWRSLSPFAFNYEDVAIIILPKEAKEADYVAKLIKEMKIPRRIPIASWEDLVDH